MPWLRPGNLPSLPSPSYASCKRSSWVVYHFWVCYVKRASEGHVKRFTSSKHTNRSLPLINPEINIKPFSTIFLSSYVGLQKALSPSAMHCIAAFVRDYWYALFRSPNTHIHTYIHTYNIHDVCACFHIARILPIHIGNISIHS